jgi:hypothetical protein
VVCVFARKTSEPLTSLVKQIDKKIDENSNLKAFVVVLTGKGGATRKELEGLAKDAGIKHVPLTMVQDTAGPPDYEIAKDADYTVLMWHRHKVKANHAFKGDLADKDIEAVVGDIPKILGD